MLLTELVRVENKLCAQEDCAAEGHVEQSPSGVRAQGWGNNSVHRALGQRQRNLVCEKS